MRNGAGFECCFRSSSLYNRRKCSAATEWDRCCIGAIGRHHVSGVGLGIFNTIERVNVRFLFFNYRHFSGGVGWTCAILILTRWRSIWENIVRIRTFLTFTRIHTIDCLEFGLRRLDFLAHNFTKWQKNLTIRNVCSDVGET